MEKATTLKKDPVSQKEILYDEGHGPEIDISQTSRPEDITKENIAFSKDFTMTEILSGEEFSKAHVMTGKIIKYINSIIYQKNVENGQALNPNIRNKSLLPIWYLFGRIFEREDILLMSPPCIFYIFLTWKKFFTPRRIFKNTSYEALNAALQKQQLPQLSNAF